MPSRLRGVDGGPVSPTELEDRVFAQCEEARTVLMKKWLPEVAMVFVKQRKAWASLVPRSVRVLRQKFSNLVSFGTEFSF